MVVGMLIAGLFTSSSMLMVPESSAVAVITSIAPNSGSVTGGETLTVTGSGFQSVYGDYIPVEYIQFYKDTGNAMYPLIDTLVPLNNNTEVTATYMVTDHSYQLVWGAEGADEIRLESGEMTDPIQSTAAVVWQYFHVSSSKTISQFARVAESSGVLRVKAGNGNVITTLVQGSGALYPSVITTYGLTSNGGHIVVGARQTGFFTGRIYGFSIVNGLNGTVQFNGIPAYGWGINAETKVGSYQYGLYDTVSGQFFVNSLGANQKVEGKIWGPSGVNGVSPLGTTMTVTFSDPNNPHSRVSCDDLDIVDSTTATCTVPPSMLPGDGAGTVSVEVSVTVDGLYTDNVFSYTYTRGEPTITSVTPDAGSMLGGNTVTLTGSYFATALDELKDSSGATITAPTGTHPAAWTVNDQTVFGFADTETGELTPAEGTGVYGLDGGTVFPVAPTQVLFGQAAASAITVTSQTTMTVVAPPNDPGVVDLFLDMNGVEAWLENAYTYLLDATLEITMEGWDCPPGALIDDGDDLCRVIPEGSWLVSGARATWVYTVTYVAIGANGQPLDPSLGQLTDVMVNDAKQGLVCQIDTLPLNEPYQCSVTGLIEPG